MVSRIETIDLADLRAFVETARAASMTEAATRLGLGKSAVSKAVRAVEERLGVRLFERKGRTLELTHEGALVLARAESILADVERLVEDVRERATTPSGLVRVSASPELGAELARAFFPPLLARLPGLRIALDVDYALADVLDPLTDLAFRVGRVADDRLVVRELGRFGRSLYAVAAVARSIRAPEDLERCDCLGFSATETQATLPLRRGDAVRTLAADGRFAARSFTALLRAAEAGAGVALLPDFLAAPSLAAGALVRALPGWSAPPVKVHLVHRPGHQRIARVRAVVDEALRAIPELLAGF